MEGRGKPHTDKYKEIVSDDNNDDCICTLHCTCHDFCCAERRVFIDVASGILILGL